MTRTGAATLLSRVVLSLAVLTASTAGADPPSLRQHAASLATQQNRTPVAQSLLRRGRPVIKVRSGADADRIASALPSTFEVIFRPDASKWGHAHIRVGETVYDLGSAWDFNAKPIRTAPWINYGEAYGFVFACDASTKSRLQAAYGEKVRKLGTGELKYQLKPWETPRPQGENCETFVTSTLRQLCPSLGLYPQGRYAGAIGLAQWCLASPKLEAITVYSTGDAAAREGFKLRKLE